MIKKTPLYILPQYLMYYTLHDKYVDNKFTSRITHFILQLSINHVFDRGPNLKL